MGAADDNAEAPLVSLEEHEAGQKTITVLQRTGKELALTLQAPNWRKARTVAEALSKGGDPEILIAACLEDAAILDKLAPASVEHVLAVAFSLTFGAEAEKKMAAAGRDLLTRLPGCESKTPASKPAGRPKP